MQPISLPLAPPSPQESTVVQSSGPSAVESAITEDIDSSEEIKSITATSQIDSPIVPSNLSSTSESRTAKPVSDRSVRKLLLPIVSTSLGVALLLWLGRQSGLQGQSLQNLFVSSGPSREQIEARMKANANAQFVRYMQQTLALIDQNPQHRQEVASLPDRPAQTNVISPEPVTNRPLPANNRLPTVLERVYIPVYQPPSAASQPSSIPISPPPSSSEVALLPPPPPPSSEVALLPPPPSPQQVAIAPEPVSISPSSVASKATHTLVGILELGKQSAALFDIDGVTQRFRVGDNIGDSGWKLVEISRQEAIMGRNGQLRSIYVGQKL